MQYIFIYMFCVFEYILILLRPFSSRLSNINDEMAGEVTGYRTQNTRTVTTEREYSMRFF